MLQSPIEFKYLAAQTIFFPLSLLKIKINWRKENIIGPKTVLNNFPFLFGFSAFYGGLAIVEGTGKRFDHYILNGGKRTRGNGVEDSYGQQ